MQSFNLTEFYFPSTFSLNFVYKKNIVLVWWLYLGWREDGFPWTRNRPSEKKTFHLGKVFNKNQTFDIQIAMSIALSWSIT